MKLMCIYDVSVVRNDSLHCSISPFHNNNQSVLFECWTLEVSRETRDEEKCGYYSLVGLIILEMGYW